MISENMTFESQKIVLRCTSFENVIPQKNFTPKNVVNKISNELFIVVVAENNDLRNGLKMHPIK